MKFLHSLLLFSLVGTLVQADSTDPQAPDASLAKAFQEARLFARPDGQGTKARLFFNEGHGLRARVDGGGFSITLGDSDQSSFSQWRTVALGYGQQPAAIGAGEIAGEGSRLEIRRPVVTEWLVNRPEGLEHGYTITTRPGGHEAGGPLRVWVDVATSDDLVMADDGQGLLLVKDSEGREWRYEKLKVWDADGRPLRAAILPREGGFAIEVEEASARYPVVIDPLFARSDYLKASNTGTGDMFGFSVATDGVVAVIGAVLEDGAATVVNGADDDTKSGSGAAYVFRLVNGTWVFEAYLKASNSGGLDEFGYSVDVDGDVIVVGARHEQGSGAGVNAPADDLLDKSGAAYVFARSGGVWSQQAYLKPAVPGLQDLFGFAVGVSGELVIVGAYFEDGTSTGINQPVTEGATNSGAAYIFRRVNGTDWQQEAYLKASNAGSPDNFGIDVAIDGDLAIVGAPGERSDATGVNGNQANNSINNAGAAYLFRRTGGVWAQEAYLKASNPGESDQFGRAVDVEGGTVIVGVSNEDSSTTLINGPVDDASINSGAAYVFVNGLTGWEQKAFLKAPNADPGDGFGGEVALDGDFAVVSADLEESGTSEVDGTPDDTVSQAGAVYVFRRTGDEWANQAYLKSSAPGIGQRFGFALAAADGIVLVGEPFENTNATGVNPIQTGSGASSSGAAHVFRLLRSKLEISGAKRFKTTLLRSKSKPLRVLLRNTGGAPLGGLSLSIAGKARSDFKLVTPGVSMIEPGGSATATIVFKPKKAGKRKAILNVTTASESRTIPLLGKGK